jgi:MtN3 and saliva related transmembrane protein
MLGFIAGTLTTAALAPQLVHSLRTGSTKDVSLAMLVCISVGMSLWLAHGLMIGDPALVIANAGSLVLALPMIILKLKNG